MIQTQVSAASSSQVAPQAAKSPEKPRSNPPPSQAAPVPTADADAITGETTAVKGLVLEPQVLVPPEPGPAPVVLSLAGAWHQSRRTRLVEKFQSVKLVGQHPF